MYMLVILTHSEVAFWNFPVVDEENNKNFNIDYLCNEF